MNNLSYVSGQLLIIGGVGWIIHEYVESKEEGQRAAPSQGAGVPNINFGKYMDKKPKFEREFGKTSKQQDALMQEMSSSVYKPPEMNAQYKMDNDV